MLQKSIFASLGISFLLLSCKDQTLFQKLDSSETNITFENTLTETDKENILSYEYFYNGAGVAAGDFNNDGLTDLFFSGNQVPNKLYLNKGNLKGESLRFEDISKTAGIEGRKGWRTGVSLADVNQDGFLDIYVCYSGINSPEERKNQLFINNGRAERLAFTDQAEAYGVADIGYSTHATFFDYDLDGDLDLFVLNHNLKNYQRKEAAQMKSSVDTFAGDRLYQNNLNSGTGGFTDVTLSAGIKSNPLGFGLGVVSADFNQDNLPDLYIANDYVEEDYLYLNNGNGTFSEVGKEAMGHFSYSAMGVDAADVNNDGLVDLFTADMLPEDNARQKLLAFPDNWNVQLSMLENGFHWQNMRNMLQINQGAWSKEQGADGNSPIKKNAKLSASGYTPKFSEIGQLAGVSATDWSWGPLFADFDNDGLKDLFVSNGFVKDLTDLDFVKYLLDQESKSQSGQATETLLQQAKKMPSTPTHHYIFRNNGNLLFENKVKEWGFEQNTIASGSVYADLDNDGDLDIITNNNNEKATIYKNLSQEQSKKNYLKVALKGKKENQFGIGTKVWIYYAGKQQMLEKTISHGFQSSIIENLHFGLGEVSKIDSVKIIWQDGNIQTVLNPKINGVLNISYANSTKSPFSLLMNKSPLFFEENTIISKISNIENPNIDFNRQILLPKLYSKVSPKFTKGDINADGLEDIFVCSPKNQNSLLLTQTPNNQWIEKKTNTLKPNIEAEDMDANLVDIDNDKDLDLIILSGGYEQVLEDKINEDRIFLNDGKGNFQPAPQGFFPSILTNKARLKNFDYDKDGDIDLFILGGVRAGLYPYSDPSFLLKNNGKGQFSIAQKFDLGLSSDVAIADLNKDSWQDLVIVGEFMPISLFENQKGKFEIQPKTAFENSEGWYNRIEASDLDQDGDIDFVVGNMGLNTPFRASVEKPVNLFYGDFDQNNTIDPFITKYFGDKSYPIAGRDEALEQMVSWRKKFTDYKSYSIASIDDIFKEDFSKLQKQSIFELQTGILINDGGNLTWKSLPIEAQTSPIYAILVEDFNKDGIKDILLAGNESGFRIRIGKTDANYGTVLLGKKGLNFEAISPIQSGLLIDGDVKDILKIKNQILFGVNNAKMQVYSIR